MGFSNRDLFLFKYNLTLMITEALALIASFFSALSSVLATKGMKDSNVDTANLVMTGVQTIVLSILLLRDVPEMDVVGLLWFSLAGISGSFIGRLLTLQSYHRIGVASSSALIGTSPLLTIFLAILFLGEPLILSVILGSLFVVVGVVLINMREGKLSIRWNSIYLPVSAAFLYAISNILRKMGTNILPHSVFGAQSSTFVGFITFIIYLKVKDRFSEININKENSVCLVGSGVCNAIAWIALTTALIQGKVSITTSIVYSFPLFSVFLSYLFLKDMESINKFIVVGSILIVIGVLTVTFWS